MRYLTFIRAPSFLNYFLFQSFDSDRIRWRLLQKCVENTKLDIYVLVQYVHYYEIDFNMFTYVLSSVFIFSLYVLFSLQHLYLVVIFLLEVLVSRKLEFTAGFQWGSCYSIFSFMYMSCRSLFVLLSIFSFVHCVVCSSIYGFWLHLWYLQTLLIID